MDCFNSTTRRTSGGLGLERTAAAMGLLQWGPVVVTGIRGHWATDDGYTTQLQWGPVVVTGIRLAGEDTYHGGPRCFNGVR